MPSASSHKRKRPYLARRAKRHCASPPPFSPPLKLQTIPEDAFHRIIANLQNGTHIRGKVFQTGRHAFSLAQVSSTTLNRYKETLHTIDAAASSERDPSVPPLLREYLPPHIRNLVTIAGSSLRTLRLPRYERSQIGAEDVLRVIHHCTNLKNLSFVDAGRVDRNLRKSIFGDSLEVIAIEKPRFQVVDSLARCSAPLRDVQLSYVPFSAMDRVIDMVTARGQSIKRLSLSFDEKLFRKGGKKNTKATSPMAELRRFLNLIYLNLTEWLPRLEEFQVTCCEERDLEHNPECGDGIIKRGIAEVSRTVNYLRASSGGDGFPSELRVISLCGSTLVAIPRLLNTAEIRVRLPGYALRYRGKRDEVAKPCLSRFQITTAVETYDIHELWRMTCGIDTLNIGTVNTVLSYYPMREQVGWLVRNATNLRRVIVRLALDRTDVALQVMKYVRDILTAAPWVTELEISHEIISFSSRNEFKEMLTAMSELRVLHLSAPSECLKASNKGRISFVKRLPKVLRRLATVCEGLEVLYCERIGRSRAISAKKTREDVIRKLGEIDVVMDGRFNGVDCTSLKALVVHWAEYLKYN